jgi:transcription elongation factor GreB
MSRAFTREDDARDPIIPRQLSPLLPGTRNYLTASGAERLRRELARLQEQERPRLVARAAEGAKDGADAGEELAVVENRIATLQHCLSTAQVSHPPQPPHDVVRFGATVTVRDQAGAETTYRIVGADETEPEKNAVSWQSPLARALLNARLGAEVSFNSPSGPRRLRIAAIRYE